MNGNTFRALMDIAELPGLTSRYALNGIQVKSNRAAIAADGRILGIVPERDESISDRKPKKTGQILLDPEKTLAMAKMESAPVGMRTEIAINTKRVAITNGRRYADFKPPRKEGKFPEDLGACMPAFGKILMSVNPGLLRKVAELAEEAGADRITFGVQGGTDAETPRAIAYVATRWEDCKEQRDKRRGWGSIYRPVVKALGALMPLLWKSTDRREMDDLEYRKATVGMYERVKKRLYP